MSSDFENDDFDEFDNDYEYVPYHSDIIEAIAPIIKQYLADYYGERMGELEAEIYIEIEKALKDGFIFVEMIPEILFNNRSITHAEFDVALEAYSPSGKTFNWPRPEHWFDRDYSDDDNDDTFLEDSDPIDLTEEQRMAKKVVDHINNMQNEHAAFANFIKMGFDRLTLDVQAYLVKTTIFDLEILTEKGLEKLQECISLTIEDVLEKLYNVVEGDLRNKE